jgi:hypothetical protein
VFECGGKVACCKPRPVRSDRAARYLIERGWSEGISRAGGDTPQNQADIPAITLCMILAINCSFEIVESGPPMMLTATLSLSGFPVELDCLSRSTAHCKLMVTPGKSVWASAATTICDDDALILDRYCIDRRSIDRSACAPVDSLAFQKLSGEKDRQLAARCLTTQCPFIRSHHQPSIAAEPPDVKLDSYNFPRRAISSKVMSVYRTHYN